MAATLKVLGEEKVAGRRIAVLGAMRELGADSRRLPRRSGRAGSRRPQVDYAILVGEEMEALAKALGGTGQNGACARRGVGASPLAREAIGPGDAMLVKGSNSIGLAALVEALAGGKRLMFLWIAEQLGFPGVLNLFRYITFRAGAATATALVHRPADRAQVHRLAARPPGQGPADPRRRPADRTSPSAARRPWAG